MGSVSNTLTVDCPSPLVAGELVTVTFCCAIGNKGMAEGGRFRIALPNPGWGKPLVPQPYFWDCYQKGKDRQYTNYDRVNTTAQVVSARRHAVPFLNSWPGFREPFGFPRRWLHNYDKWWIEVVLEDDGLDPGDRIVVTYGDPTRLPLSARVQGFPEQRTCFLAYVDPSGDNSWSEAEDSPWMVNVVSGPASRIDAFVPSISRPGEELEVRVCYTDAVHTEPRAAPRVGTLLVDGVPQAVDEESSSLQLKTPAREEGCCRVIVVDQERGWSARSNPSVCRATGHKLYWGDLHAQSQYHAWCEEDRVGISCGTPEELYEFARDVAGLDFCAITDTDSICKEIWPEMQRLASEANRDGRFVVFSGSEVGDNTDGHRSLILASQSPEPRMPPNKSSGGESQVNARRAQEYFHGREDAILIYHHTKIWNNWSRWDSSVEPLLEIYSSWGSGERAGTDLWEVLAEMTGGAQEAWAKGYRLGVTGGSDTHVGTPGRRLGWCERDEMLIYPNGITGVWAEELTQASVFQALRQRRCCATTGERIILELSIDGNPMGSEVLWDDPSRPRLIQATVQGTSAIDSVTIVKNGEDVVIHQSANEDVSFEWSDNAITQGSDYYYIRVDQRDNARAWSSPIWVDVPADH